MMIDLMIAGNSSLWGRGFGQQVGTISARSVLAASPQPDPPTRYTICWELTDA
jgi:hypothetical protein